MVLLEHLAIRPASIMLIALATVAGCSADGDPEVLNYRAPLESQGKPIEFTIGTNRERAHRVTLAQLDAAGLAIEENKPDLIVARYNGPATAFVECGLIERQGENGSTITVPATASLALTEEEVDMAGYDPKAFSILRHISLDARVIVRLDQDPGRSGDDKTSLTWSAQYVVTKTVDVLEEDGEVIGSSRDAIAFPSGFDATFASGTICQPTGKLETLGLSSQYQIASTSEKNERTAPEPYGNSTVRCRVPIQGRDSADISHSMCELLKRLANIDGSKTNDILIVSQQDKQEMAVEFGAVVAREGYFYLDVFSDHGAVNHARSVWIENPAGSEKQDIFGTVPRAANGPGLILATLYPSPLPQQARMGLNQATDYITLLERLALDGQKPHDMQLVIVN